MNLLQDISIKQKQNGIYKADIDIMLEDRKKGYEFKALKECENVREKLLNKYYEIGKEINNSKIDIYAELNI